MTLTPKATGDVAVIAELADRCEQATGPDRELDLCIWRLVDPNAASVEEAGRTPLPWLHCYTASLDAAMTLSDGIAVLITLSEIKGDGMPHCVFGNPETSDLFEAVAETMPLAVCAAALRAKVAHLLSQAGEP